MASTGGARGQQAEAEVGQVRQIGLDGPAGQNAIAEAGTVECFAIVLTGAPVSERVAVQVRRAVAFVRKVGRALEEGAVVVPDRVVVGGVEEGSRFWREIQAEGPGTQFGRAFAAGDRRLAKRVIEKGDAGIQFAIDGVEVA